MSVSLFQSIVYHNFIIFMRDFDCRSNWELSPFRFTMSLVVRNPFFGVSDQVRHKPGCTTTEDGVRLENSDLGNRGIVLSE